MRLISRYNLAQLAGVSPAAVTRACSRALAPACVGQQVDLDHPAAAAYAARAAAAPTTAGCWVPSRDVAELRTAIEAYQTARAAELEAHRALTTAARRLLSRFAAPTPAEAP